MSRETKRLSRHLEILAETEKLPLLRGFVRVMQTMVATNKHTVLQEFQLEETKHQSNFHFEMMTLLEQYRKSLKGLGRVHKTYTPSLDNWASSQYQFFLTLSREDRIILVLTFETLIKRVA